MQDTAQLDTHRFLLRFGSAPFPRLHIGLHPGLSTIHLARGLKAPGIPTETAATLSRELAGRRVESLWKDPLERLLKIGFEGGRVLIVELMGKASNLLLLDDGGTILRFARSHGGSFRRPAIGAPYQPPARSSRWVAPSPSEVTEAQFRGIVGAVPPGRTLEAQMVEAFPAFSVHLAREIVFRAGLGEGIWEVFCELRDRLASGRIEPVLYSPSPPAELPESVTLSSGNFFPFVFPLRHAGTLCSTRLPTVNEAEETAASCKLRHLEYMSLSRSLTTHLQKEARRVSDLTAVLRRELEETGSSERDRRRGELLLAGMSSARKEGNLVRVIDHYDPEGRAVEIPIDGRLDLKGNAERFFKAARKAERAGRIIPGRLAQLERRGPAVAAAIERVRAATARAQLEAVEKTLQSEGMLTAFRKAGRRDAGGKQEYVEVRQFRSTDGFTILVGKSGAENDNLTFSVAAPHDLWLHAAGYAGAHVVVRNPGRLSELPEATVRQAAAIAAYFSKGRSERNLDVHVSWRRHVRKGKGMSPGMVTLKRHRTVRVSPSLPGGNRGAN